MAPRGIFITGTDTGVGKTVVAATVARLLRMKGLSVGVMKPVTSGCREVSGRLVSDDATLLSYAAGIPCSDDVALYRLRAPLAPSEAARLDGVKIDFSVIKAAFARLASIYDYVIVEGAGGLMVPLSGGLLIADLARELELPLLVVARPGLGTINHTVLTCYAAQQLGLQVAGVIINGMPDQPDRAEKGASHHIGSLCGASILGVWPKRDETDQMKIVDEMAVWLDGQVETNIVLRELGVCFPV
jgi:dethiobiotin synthetase